MVDTFRTLLPGFSAATEFRSIRRSQFLATNEASRRGERWTVPARRPPLDSVYTLDIYWLWCTAPLNSIGTPKTGDTWNGTG